MCNPIHKRTLWLLLFSLGACRQPSPLRPSLITDSEILAVQAEPAEVAPGDQVTYRALVVDPEGTLLDAAVDWAYCTTPRLLTENTIVSAACASHAEHPLPSHTLQLQAEVPQDACARFGSDVMPPGRPSDPDGTGGYYQPLRIAVQDKVAVAMQRIVCPLRDAPIAIAGNFRDHYQRNRNPALTPLLAYANGASVQLDHLRRSSRVLFSTGWGADSAESFVVYDRSANALVQERESLQVSWYVSAGALRLDQTGRSADDHELRTQNEWSAPDEPGPVQLWLVLRDSRGGESFTQYLLKVTQ